MRVNFSGALLVKNSAKQLCYKRSHVPKSPASEKKEEGNTWALEQAKSKYFEMQGEFVNKNLHIYFTIDEVRKRLSNLTLIEHKMVDPEASEWFFHSSLIQTAFFGAMAQHVDKLYTAKFYKGDRHEILLESKTLKNVLNFGGKKWKVEFDSSQVIRFFLTKARASLEYDSAIRFDKRYKHREWDDWFKDLIQFKKV
jgi:hypothetical protein